MMAVYGVNKSALRNLFLMARLKNHMYIMISIKEPIGPRVIVIPRHSRDAYDTEFENNFWEINGKLVDIRNESIEIVDFASGPIGYVTDLAIKE